MKLTDLNNSKIAIWGKGQEGLATAKFLSEFLDIKEIIFLDDYDTTCIKPSIENLIKFEYIIKSPGISAYKSEYLEAKKLGVKFLSPSGIWFALNKPGRKICVTGTKGKSTTSSLLAFMLEKLGFKTLLCGNIGIPLTSDIALKEDFDFYVIELSSYQIKDLKSQGISVGDLRILVNLYPEHIDWHQTTENYFNDKLELFDENGINLISQNDPITQKYINKISEPNFFNIQQSFHLKNNDIYYGKELFYSHQSFSLQGEHYLLDLIAGFEALRLLGIDPKPILDLLSEFKPLPHRMNILGKKAGITYIDDSISTIPETSIAALETIKNKKVALLIGGFERGQAWSTLINYLADKTNISLICLPQNGKRLYQELSGNQIQSFLVEDLESGTKKAVSLKPDVILLSPGAPSYGSYKNYIQRGLHFKQIFEMDEI